MNVTGVLTDGLRNESQDLSHWVGVACAKKPLVLKDDDAEQCIGHAVLHRQRWRLQMREGGWNTWGKQIQ